MRRLPPGFIFDSSAPCLFAQDLDLLGAYLNSSIAVAIAEGLNPTSSFQVGDLGRLPAPNFADAERISELGKQAFEVAREIAACDLTSAEYRSAWPLLRAEASLSARLKSIVEAKRGLVERRLGSINAEIDMEFESRLSSGRKTSKHAMQSTTDGDRDAIEIRDAAENALGELVLIALGHRWPLQIEAGEPVSDWAELSGIIPLTTVASSRPMIERLRDRLAYDFGSDRVGAIEREFEEILGKPLAAWLESDFFKHHISHFKRRPIAWQIQSEPPSGNGASGKGKNSRKLTRRRAPLLSYLVYSHRLDDGLLETLRVGHIGQLRKSLQTEHSGLSDMKTRTPDQDVRRAELEVQIEELSEFDQRLQALIERGFTSSALEKIADKEIIDKWTSRDGKAVAAASRDSFVAQEQRYDPDVNDGVRVNIAPLQKAGLLAADVIATKDLEKAISDRAKWRADERRWCRENKLPQPGWWNHAEYAETVRSENRAS